MSDFGTRGPGSIPWWALIIYFFFYFVRLVMQNYFVQVLWNYINDKKKLPSLTFQIELSLKFVGEGLNLALLKDN